jgi:hypothetical protein
MPLNELDRGCQILSDRAQTLEQHIPQLPIKCLRQAIQILSKGADCDSGKGFHEEINKHKHYEKLKTEIGFLYKSMLYSNLVIQYLFNDIDQCLQGLKTYNSITQKEELCAAMTSVIAFVEGLSHISQARRSGQLKASRASYCSYILQKLSKHDPTSNLGRYMLLEAELLDLCSYGSDLYGYMSENTYPKYVAAVAVAAKSDSLLTIAVSNEVAANYIVRNQRKKYSLPTHEALQYFTAAITAYKKWGAVAKVRHLEQEMQVIDFTK